MTTLRGAQRIAIPHVPVPNMDGAAYVVSTVLALFANLSVFQIWLSCFSVFFIATIALLVRVSSIPPVVLPDEVPHTRPRPHWLVKARGVIVPGGREADLNPSWRLGLIFGSAIQRALYPPCKVVLWLYFDSWTAMLVAVWAVWTAYVTVDRAVFTTLFANFNALLSWVRETFTSIRLTVVLCRISVPLEGYMHLLMQILRHAPHMSAAWVNEGLTLTYSCLTHIPLPVNATPIVIFPNRSVRLYTRAAWKSCSSDQAAIRASVTFVHPYVLIRLFPRLHGGVKPRKGSKQDAGGASADAGASAHAVSLGQAVAATIIPAHDAPPAAVDVLLPAPSMTAAPEVSPIPAASMADAPGVSHMQASSPLSR